MRVSDIAHAHVVDLPGSIDVEADVLAGQQLERVLVLGHLDTTEPSPMGPRPPAVVAGRHVRRG